MNIYPEFFHSVAPIADAGLPSSQSCHPTYLKRELTHRQRASNSSTEKRPIASAFFFENTSRGSDGFEEFLELMRQLRIGIDKDTAISVFQLYLGWVIVFFLRWCCMMWCEDQVCYKKGWQTGVKTTSLLSVMSLKKWELRLGGHRRGSSTIGLGAVLGASLCVNYIWFDIVCVYIKELVLRDDGSFNSWWEKVGDQWWLLSFKRFSGGPPEHHPETSRSRNWIVVIAQLSYAVYHCHTMIMQDSNFSHSYDYEFLVMAQTLHVWNKEYMPTLTPQTTPTDQ